MNEESRRSDSGREVTGLIIILIGFALLLNTMNILPFASLISRFWLPLLFVAIGVVHMSRSGGADAWKGGVFWIGMGALFFFGRLNYFTFNVWKLLGPVIVIWVGLSIVLRGTSQRTRNRTARDGRAGSLDSSDSVSATAILGEFNRKCTSQQFKGGDLTAIMGGGRIDLLDAGLQSNDVVLDVFTVIGGIEIRVPQDWIVEDRVTTILGSVEDKTQAPLESGKRLTIRGTIIMSSIELKN